VGKRRIFFTQYVAGPTSSIQRHIHYHEVNKFKTLRFDEQINDHIDMSTQSIEMSFKSSPSVHLDQFEEFEAKKQGEEVVQVHESNLVAHTPPMEQVEFYCEDECDDDESVGI